MLNAPVPASATGLPLDRRAIEDLIETLIAMLDGMDADPDLEPYLGFHNPETLLDGEEDAGEEPEIDAGDERESDADEEPDLGWMIASGTRGVDPRPEFEARLYWTEVDFEGSPGDRDSEQFSDAVRIANGYKPFAERPLSRYRELRALELQACRFRERIIHSGS